MSLWIVAIIACAALAAPLFADEDPTTLTLDDPRVTVSGLPWLAENQTHDKGSLIRLPIRLKDTFKHNVWTLGQAASGARVRFRTDSTTLTLDAKVMPVKFEHMPLTGTSGIDVYVDGRYLGTAVPDRVGKVARFKHGGGFTLAQTRSMRDVTLYLPLYSAARVNAIVLDSGSRVEPAAPFALARPVVYYGSSITQGGSASNAGGVYMAILERWLNVDYVNLGFSGAGHGQPEVARAMAEIDAAAFVLDYWANPSVDQLRDTLPEFVRILRERHPTTPILIPGPYWEPADAATAEGQATFEGKRDVIRAFVEQRRAAGDAHITYIDGYEMLGPDQSFGLVDARHANAAGFYFMAKGLEPHLRAALGLANGR